MSSLQDQLLKSGAINKRQANRDTRNKLKLIDKYQLLTEPQEKIKDSHDLTDK